MAVTETEKLEEFAELAMASAVLDSDELRQIYTPEIVQAIGSLIMEKGHRPRVIQPDLRDMRRLVVGDRFRKIVGEAGENNDGQPSPIYLAEFARKPLRFRRQKFAVLSSNGSLYSAADNGSDFFMPSSVSEDTIKLYRDEMGETVWHSEPGGPQTGLELAGEAIRNRSNVLNGFLQTVGYLIKESTVVKPV